MAEQFKKDPNALLDYTWDWSLWLAAGETIASAVITVPDGLTESSSSTAATSVTVWISGGVAGSSYKLGCKVTTTAGRIDERTIVLKCVER